MIAKLAHRVRKVRIIGLHKALRAWHNKTKIKKTAIVWQQNNGWMGVMTPEVVRWLDADFQQLFLLIKRRSFAFMHTLYLNEPSATIITDANQYMHCTFDILGSELCAYKTMPWAVDIRLLQQNPTADNQFDTNTYFAHMALQQSATDALEKDIKVPWELSRFTYLPILAKAYVLTGDRLYVDTIIAHASDWIKQNPFLYGPNWVNAMEVAIRAMNWIAAFDLAKNALTLSFSQQFITALYQHMVYLEHNWEYYDSRTNNHYLANLVGYLYLVHFFADMPGMQKKFHWCVAELLHELDKQVFDEGTSYEGSTNYHRLVTELYYLVYVLLQDKHLIVSQEVVLKLQRMISFLVWCTPHNGSLVAIGDHDSGVIMRTGLAYQKLATIWSHADGGQPPYATFDTFGLSVIKSDSWHVTLRHHAYQPLQPSGHFHNDVGSITLSVHGIPLFVDPGSFVYTASAVWRNYFRSTSVHNTFFIQDSQQVLLDERLFELDLPTGASEKRTYKQGDIIYMSTRHGLYKKHGLFAQRDLAYDMSTQVLMMSDTWLSDIKQHSQTSAWNFTLAPDIVPIQECKDRWLLLHNGKPVVSIQSHDLLFVVQPAWISPRYGVKVKSHALYAHSSIAIDKSFVITIRGL